ncbi:MAG: RdgB/HAM1 family non-canonical purine NTP pyrophosphatase [Candidatus Cloacimonetes bacterium]|jgi:XTP/dITP diphosphohydrolase|nr:RdgB/HAM1 family non-canonical purine NTP pyrophosphatase [Candidatus Cloacimonadota bacterium]MBT6994124.1 RdgB/HAM1 family non-canonical purine NTP pyrophosphatase [Candidatus Cloacimonadota bacterium]MBT7469836.1 RdgB/HAM1 family non-canonical purine NTP pyrophosphatase [Candidatus Cloacimonadota bacterium]
MKSNKIVIASRNKDKIIEIKEILTGLDFEFVPALDFLDLPDVIEDKETIAGNAIKKAMETAQNTGMLALADDTGFFVDALDGKPGVYAARYAGEVCTYKDNREKMLKEMQGQNNRKAQFKTVVAFASPTGLIGTAEGKVEGTITLQDEGEGGFGYDPIFRADETGKTFGEMNNADKNKISHRGRAFRNIIPILGKIKF